MRRVVAKVGLAVVALDLFWVLGYAVTAGLSDRPPPNSVVLERAYVRDGTTVRARNGELEVVGDGGFGQSRSSRLVAYLGLGLHVALAGVAATACGLLLRDPPPTEPAASMA